MTLFLWQSVNEKLRPKLWRKLKPGTRVVSYVHSMGDWRPQEEVNVEGAYGPRKVFLWIIPERTGRRTRGIGGPRLVFAVNQQEENHAYPRAP